MSKTIETVLLNAIDNEIQNNDYDGLLSLQNAQSFNTVQNSFADSDIEDGMIYFYRIRASDYSGNWID